MTNTIKLWSMRAIVVLVFAFLAYTGGSLLEQATATSEIQYCENDRCRKFLDHADFCVPTQYSNTGCDKTTPWTCRTYSCDNDNVGSEEPE